MDNSNKLVIIGGGLGGYPAAIKVARQGVNVTLIEREKLGGTCLNWGCIPTKSFLHVGSIIETIRNAKNFGITCSDYELDFKAVVAHKDSVVNRLREGVENLLKAKKIEILQGTAEFINSEEIRIRETDQTIKFQGLILASGSKPIRPDFSGSNGPDVLDSKQVIGLETLPKSVAIIGGGVIGVEFAQIFNRFGVKVTILELLDNLLPGVDHEMVDTLGRSLSEAGIEILTGARVKKINHRNGKNTVHFGREGKNYSITVGKVVLAVGRKPYLDDLCVDRIGLAVQGGAVVVNNRMQTNVSNIYAAGDITGGVMLAHVAMAESECAADNFVGHVSEMSYKAVPSCIYTSPEVASVGLSEESACQVADIQVGRFPFYACGKAMVLNQMTGMVKIISEKKYGEVLGVHIIGPHATEMISEAVLGMSMEMTVEELANAMHPHPSLSEAVMESAKMLSGGAIHMP